MTKPSRSPLFRAYGVNDMIGIICFWDRYATPYLSKYERMLNDADVPYEVVFWNRESDNRRPLFRQDGCEVYFDYKCKEGKKKYLSFFVWARKVSAYVKMKGYSHLILLSTVPAVLLIQTVLRNYNERYIFDIRDYTFEKNPICRKLVMRLVNNSCLTTISSKGFMRWLEESPKILPNHNITVNDFGSFSAPEFPKGRPIRLSFVGNVRLDTQTEAMLKTLGRGLRIEQHFYGRVLKVCNIEKIVEEGNLNNIFLHGPFVNKDKVKIYGETDLINTVYANAKREDDIPLGDSTPLPNRLYDALVFYRPLVTSKGTYLAELSDKFHLGVNVNGFDKDIEDTILKYVKSFDGEQFMAGCDALKAIVLSEENAFCERVRQIFNSWR